MADTLPVDFDTPAARLALLDGETLDRLSLRLGLVIDGAEVRRIITADAVKAVREALGTDAYSFAVQRAPLLAPARRSRIARPQTPRHCRRRCPTA